MSLCPDCKANKKLNRMLAEIATIREFITEFPRIIFDCAVIDNTIIIKGDLKMLTLTDLQQVQLTIAPKDKKGKPAQLDGPPVWTSSDASIASVVPAEDGLSALASATDNLGPVQISVTADVRMGPDVVALVGTLDITVVASEAVTLDVTAGTPSEQPGV